MNLVNARSEVLQRTLLGRREKQLSILYTSSFLPPPPPPSPPSSPPLSSPFPYPVDKQHITTQRLYSLFHSFLPLLSPPLLLLFPPPSLPSSYSLVLLHPPLPLLQTAYHHMFYILPSLPILPLPYPVNLLCQPTLSTCINIMKAFLLHEASCSPSR